MINEKNNKRNVTLLNILFALWLFCEIMFAYTTISRIALLIFVIVAIFVVQKFTWSYALFSYFLLILWSSLNIFTGHATDNTLAKDMTQTIILTAIFLYAFCCYCRHVGDVIKILEVYRLVVAVFCVICVVGGIGSVVSGERLSTFDINSNTIATLAAYASIISFYNLLDKDRDKNKIVEIVLIILFVFTIILSGSRKGLIIPIVGFYVLLCMQRPRRFFFYSIIVIIISIVTLMLVLNVDSLYNLIGYRVEPVLQYLNGETYSESSLETRIDFIDLGLKESKESLFWGNGLDCFRIIKGAYGTYSHCNYIEILYSLGLIGIIIYYLPYIYAFFKVPSSLKKSKQNTILVLALLVPYVICDYFMVTYFTRTSLIIPFLAMLVLSKGGIAHENKKID